jgi:hypothetical protein
MEVESMDTRASSDIALLQALACQGITGKVMALQSEMLKQPQVQVASIFAHGGGIAAKAVLLRAGTMAVGGMHRFENMNLITKGDISVATEAGVVRYTVTDAPVLVISPPGTKRAVYAHADTYWISLHPTDKSTVEEVEAEFIVSDETEFLKLMGE